MWTPARIDVPAHPIPTSGPFDEAYFDDGPATGSSCYQGYLKGGYQTKIWGPRAVAIAKAASLQPGDTVLDFGCAAGYMVRALSEHTPGLQIMGLEISSAALEHADPVARPHLHHRAELDTTALRDGQFTLVVAKDVLEHVPPQDLEHVVTELRRVGSRLLVSVPVAECDHGPFVDPREEGDPTHVIRFTRESWLQLLRRKDGILPLEPEGLCAALKGADRTYAHLSVLV